jgi:hypothetical protein
MQSRIARVMFGKIEGLGLSISVSPQLGEISARGVNHALFGRSQFT